MSDFMNKIDNNICGNCQIGYVCKCGCKLFELIEVCYKLKL